MIENVGLLRYGVGKVGLTKSAEMEKEAFLPILIGIGKAIGWGLTAYGAYKATTSNLPNAIDKGMKGQWLSSDDGGYGVAGEVAEGALNAWPAASVYKGAKGGLQAGKGWLSGADDAATLTRQNWGKFVGPAWTLGANEASPYFQDDSTKWDSTSTIPQPSVYDPQGGTNWIQPNQPQPPNLTPPGGNTPGGFGFQLDGNASSNKNRAR